MLLFLLSYDVESSAGGLLGLISDSYAPYPLPVTLHHIICCNYQINYINDDSIVLSCTGVKPKLLFA